MKHSGFRLHSEHSLVTKYLFLRKQATELQKGNVMKVQKSLEQRTFNEIKHLCDNVQVVRSSW